MCCTFNVVQCMCSNAIFSNGIWSNDIWSNGIVGQNGIWSKWYLV